MARPIPRLHLSNDEAADELLSSNPFALLVGMVLDQQIPLEWAFTAPFLLADRLKAPLGAQAVAETDPGELSSIFAARPALHRFPGSMAGRVHELARIVTEEYGGDPAAIWEGVADGRELLGRVKALPGFGEQKARIFVALLGKQLGVRPAGWREASAPFGEEGSHLSIADIDSPESLARVREHKREMKLAAKKAPEPRARARIRGGRSRP